MPLIASEFRCLPVPNEQNITVTIEIVPLFRFTLSVNVFELNFDEIFDLILVKCFAVQPLNGQKLVC